jgi:hypothetical protein
LGSSGWLRLPEVYGISLLDMRIATGKIVSGKVEVEGEPLAEGSRVTVLVREQDEPFELPDDQEQELLASIGEADRGELTDGATLLRSLR